MEPTASQPVTTWRTSLSLEGWRTADSDLGWYRIRAVRQPAGWWMADVTPEDDAPSPSPAQRSTLAGRIARPLHRVWITFRDAEGEPEHAMMAGIGVPVSHRGWRLDTAQHVAHADSVREALQGASLADVASLWRSGSLTSPPKVGVRRMRNWDERFPDDPWALEFAQWAESRRGLGRAEEQALAACACDGADWARRRLIESHLYIALHQALRLEEKHGLGESCLEDVVMEGCCAVVTGVDTWLRNSSERLAPYLGRYVRSRQERQSFDRDRLIPIPTYVVDDIRNWSETGVVPERLDGDEVGALASLEGRVHRFGLAEGLRDDDATPRRTGGTSAHDMADVEAVLMGFSERERLVMRYRLGLETEDGPLTLEETATRLRITRERVRQLELRAKKKLVHLVESHRLRSQSEETELWTTAGAEGRASGGPRRISRRVRWTRSR